MLTISAATSYEPESYVENNANARIDCGDALKILGFNFSKQPNVSVHMGITHRKFMRRVWTLRNLKKKGFKQADLLAVYISMIRPVAEYCHVVFASMITKRDSEELERIQAQALKSIYGWKISYRKLLLRSGLDRLDTRRHNAFLEFAKKLSSNSRYSSWFPKKVYRHHSPRPGAETYKLYPTTTERYLKSPVNSMRRLLNDLFRP